MRRSIVCHDKAAVRFLLKVAALGVLALVLLGAWVWSGLPAHGAVADLARENPGPTALMKQREREAQKAGRTPRRSQSWAPISRISRHLIHAVLAAEDQKFYLE